MGNYSHLNRALLSTASSAAWKCNAIIPHNEVLRQFLKKQAPSVMPELSLPAHVFTDTQNYY